MENLPIQAPTEKKQGKAKGPRAPRGPRAAELLDEYLKTCHTERVSLSELAAALGNRAFGASMFIFALANLLIAHIPGMSTLLGVPLIFISLQMLLGLPKPWFPARIGGASFKRETLVLVVGKTKDYLNRYGRFMTPRWLILSDPRLERPLGMICLVFSVVLALPILFGNFFPSMALTLIALGLIERDGALIISGIFFGLIAVAYAILFYSGLAHLVTWFF